MVKDEIVEDVEVAKDVEVVEDEFVLLDELVLVVVFVHAVVLLVLSVTDTRYIRNDERESKSNCSNKSNEHP